MSLEMQSQNVAVNGGSTTFTFNDDIQQFLAGIASFSLSYGDDDHYVEQISITLNANKPSSKIVTVGANAILKDASGHSIDLNNSYVTVSVIAWTGSSQPAVLLSSPYTVQNGNQSGNIPLPGSSDTILQAVLQGLYLNYSATDHEVSAVSAAVGASQNQNQGFISASAFMFDASGNEAVNPTATSALIATTLPDPGFVVATFQGQSADAVSIPMPAPITAAVSFLTGFQAKYPSSDHYIQTIGAGPNVTNVSDPNHARTSGVWAWMNDINGHSQDSNSSFASIVVVGLTA